jgi:hypothetical protein
MDSSHRSDVGLVSERRGGRVPRIALVVVAFGAIVFGSMRHAIVSSSTGTAPTMRGWASTGWSGPVATDWSNSDFGGVGAHDDWH